MMKETLIKSIRLENGQDLNLFDASKNIAADRWQVTLVARIILSVDDIFPDNNDNAPSVSEIRQTLGDTVTYEVKKQRNFIDASQKTAVVEQLLDTFLKFSAPYLSHLEFPRRFILRKYHEKSKQIQL